MSLLNSGIIVGLFTLISRITGLIRDLFIASIFGCTAVADSLNIALRLPNLFRRIFGEGALSVSFIPIFNNKMINSQEEAKIFIGKICSLLIASLIVIVLLIEIFMPWLMYVIAPGFKPNYEKFNLAITLCRITMPYIFFISLVALLGGILNSINRFFALAFSPIILNFCIVITLVLIHKPAKNMSFYVSYSIILAGVIQVLFMVLSLKYFKLTFRLQPISFDYDVKHFLRKMGPAALSYTSMQFNLFVSQVIASFLPGAISSIAYAERIYQFPLSLIGITFSTILLPNLSKLYASNRRGRAQAIQYKAIKVALWISVPATFGIILLAHPIIHVLYERGTFTSANTLEVSQILAAFAIGLPSFILNKVLTTMFYANHDTHTPFKITLYSIVINIILNLLFMNFFGSPGIALGSAATSWCTTMLFMHRSQYYLKFSLSKKTQTFMFKIAINNIFMSILICISTKYVDYYSSNLITKVFSLGITVFAGILSYLLCNYFTKPIKFKSKHSLK